MATTQAVYTETQTETMMDDTKLNPVVKEEGCEVQVTLTFRGGKSHDPGALFDALQNLGDVQTDFVPARNNYNFIITPS